MYREGVCVCIGRGGGGGGIYRVYEGSRRQGGPRGEDVQGGLAVAVALQHHLRVLRAQETDFPWTAEADNRRR